MKVWDNVIYICMMMLVFWIEEDIDKWSVRYDILKGDVRLLF